MQSTDELQTLPDDELLRRLADLVCRSRRCEADLVAHVGEVDGRRLYAREASPSMFAYCTERLHLSDAEAYLRIAAARASREHPVLLEMLADGRLHLTAIAKLAPHLTAQNREALLARAVHKSKREIEELVAERVPRSDVPAVMRKLPERSVVSRPVASTRVERDKAPANQAVLPTPLVSTSPALVPLPAPHVPVAPGGDGSTVELRLDAVRSDRLEGVEASRRRPEGVGGACIEPLAPARYRVQFTASAELHDRLERLRALMRSSVPGGDLAAVIDAAVTEKLERLESRRFGRSRTPANALPPRRAPLSDGGGPASAGRGAPSPGMVVVATGNDTASAGRASRVTGGGSPATRRVPAAVRRAVYERDEGRCRFVDAQGRRCTAREGLEFHHRRPFGHGGDHTVENLALACKAHNRYLAEVDYGREAMSRHRRWRAGALEATAPAALRSVGLEMES
jgi:5-methylcytosine-specific restriction endonuclease McrA